MGIGMSRADLLAGLRDGRLSERTALLWLEQQADDERRHGGSFAVTARGPLRGATFGDTPGDEYATLYPTPDEAAARDWSAVMAARAHAADLTDDELHAELFGGHTFAGNGGGPGQHEAFMGQHVHVHADYGGGQHSHPHEHNGDASHAHHG